MRGSSRRLRSAVVAVVAVLLLSVPAVASSATVPSSPDAVPRAPTCGDRLGDDAVENGGRRNGSSGTSAATCAPAPGILLSQDELSALPTSGPGWAAIMRRVERPLGGSYTLATRDDSNKDVLAHALAGARLDDREYKEFVRDKIEHMMTARRDVDDVLGTLRHLQTYIISADLIDLQTFDPELDAEFRTWLAAEIRFDYSGGGGGGSVISTHERKPNNFGTHAGATRIAAALYLGDDEELRDARDIWYGWATGDPDFTPQDRVWTGTSWQCDRRRPAGINAEGCTRDGESIDGVLPEDQERCGEFDWPPCQTNYVHGATDGMTLSFWMLARQGEDPWAWGDRAALRQMRWKYAVDQPPYAGFRWQIPVIEVAYGIALTGNDPAAVSTNAGYADWWAAPPADPGDDRNPPGVLPVLGVVAGLLVLVVAAIVFLRRRRTAEPPPAGTPER